MAPEIRLVLLGIPPESGSHCPYISERLLAAQNIPFELWPSLLGKYDPVHTVSVLVILDCGGLGRCLILVMAIAAFAITSLVDSFAPCLFWSA